MWSMFRYTDLSRTNRSVGDSRKRKDGLLPPLTGDKGFRLTAGLPHTRFARGPTPDDLSGREKRNEAAPGNGLSALPAARGTVIEKSR